MIKTILEVIVFLVAAFGIVALFGYAIVGFLFFNLLNQVAQILPDQRKDNK